MSMDPVELMGGESVYCINESQLQTAFKLKRESVEIQKMVSDLEAKLSRNERAALAFLLIDNLIHSN
jgi:hypothetical protein